MAIQAFGIVNTAYYVRQRDASRRDSEPVVTLGGVNDFRRLADALAEGFRKYPSGDSMPREWMIC